MSSPVRKLIVVVELVVICVLAALLFEAARPKNLPSRIETALADIHGVLSVGPTTRSFRRKFSLSIGQSRSIDPRAVTDLP